MKSLILGELANESADVLQLAYVYAKGINQAGMDLTKKFSTAMENYALASTAYNNGYRRAVMDMTGTGAALTNGDVVKTLFSNANVYDYNDPVHVDLGDTTLSFSYKWWVSMFDTSKVFEAR